MRDTQISVAFADTSQKARELYFERLKQMTTSERIDLAVALWRVGDSLQRSSLLRNNPNAEESEITFRIAVTRFGLELARKAYRKS